MPPPGPHTGRGGFCMHVCTFFPKAITTSFPNDVVLISSNQLMYVIEFLPCANHESSPLRAKSRAIKYFLIILFVIRADSEPLVQACPSARILPIKSSAP